MKPTIASLVFVLLQITYHSAVTQDLIVTNDQDSINGKILKVETDQIQFKVRYDKKTMTTFIRNEDISSYQYDYYASLVSSAIPNPEFPRFRTSLDIGFSHRTAELHPSIPKNLESYAKDLMSGLSLGAGFSYFIDRQNGIGLKARVHRSSNSMDNLYVPSNSWRRPGGTLTTMEDNISIVYIGPVYTTRILSPKNRSSWNFSLGMGYMGYNNDSSLGASNQKFSGSNLGLNVDVGHDLFVSEKLALGFEVSFLLGTLTEFNDGLRTVELEEEDYESLNRLDLTFGLRFY